VQPRFSYKSAPSRERALVRISRAARASIQHDHSLARACMRADRCGLRSRGRMRADRLTRARAPMRNNSARDSCQPRHSRAPDSRWPPAACLATGYGLPPSGAVDQVPS
jgi:hypothetical protein